MALLTTIMLMVLIILLAAKIRVAMLVRWGEWARH